MSKLTEYKLGKSVFGNILLNVSLGARTVLSDVASEGNIASSSCKIGVTLDGVVDLFGGFEAYVVAFVDVNAVCCFKIYSDASQTSLKSAFVVSDYGLSTLIANQAAVNVDCMKILGVFGILLSAEITAGIFNEGFCILINDLDFISAKYVGNIGNAGEIKAYGLFLFTEIEIRGSTCLCNLGAIIPGHIFAYVLKQSLDSAVFKGRDNA